MKTLSEDRRALHRIPETGCRLPETAAYLRGALAEMPCTLLAPWEDAVCAYFDLGKDETVAVRSDMDALPVTERTGLPFASAHPGRMHACGHDGHMAMVLGLARRLAAGEIRPQRNVLLIFEPAEETTGGAAPICATGLLERYHVTRVFGMHLWPELPAGVIASRAGAMMSRSCELTVEITGRSVHLARFAEGCDALDAAARLLTRLYALAEGKPCLLRFGKMESGSARNAVSDHTHLEGSLRCLDDGLYAALWEQAQAIGRAVGEETGCTVTMTCSSGYPPVTNRGTGALPDRRGGDDVHHGGLFGISAPCARRALLPRHRRHRAACTDVHLPGGNSGQGRSAPVRARIKCRPIARYSRFCNWEN